MLLDSFYGKDLALMKQMLRLFSLLMVLFVMLPVLSIAEVENMDEPTEEIALIDSEDAEEEIVTDDTEASIEGLTPLYTTKIKAFVSTGNGVYMRKTQDLEGERICMIKIGKTITIYKVYPSFVLAEYEGNVGFVVRTWIDENVTTLDPVNTTPYALYPSQFVATLTEKVDVHTAPDPNSNVMAIHPNAGSKIAILEFVDGYAKVLYWRSYGYIDATKLADLVTVSSTLNPMSSETPIAAFCSFFAYNTGAEGNDGRCKNIVRSCKSMSRVMQPGDQLNFNNDVGPYKKANGYFPAPVLIDGGSQLGYGGGTCQSSSTLYNTVRQVPGITIVMRRPHGPGCAKYLPMHQDAAVGNQSLNFIIRNDNDFAIRIVAESTGEGTLCIQIFREPASVRSSL